MTGRARRAASKALTRLAARAARRYVAGTELADALRVGRDLSRSGVASTICFWDSGDDPTDEVAAAYLEAIDALGSERGNWRAAIKAPALGLEPRLVTRVAQRAKEREVALHFDSLGPELADPTFELVREALPLHDRLGVTLPSRWRRSAGDAEACVELGLSVRLVKGQWEDAGGNGVAPKEGFLALVDSLAGRAREVSVATHDPPLAREALARLQAAGTACELELLLGLPMDRARPVAAEVGVPLRVYVPYGHGWLPYATSQALRNPRLLLWLARDAVSRRSPA
jgi:proline dehydrogenase